MTGDKSSFSDHDLTLMRRALEEAKRAAARGEVPVGAILAHKDSGKIAAADGNRTIELNDPSAHAELLVIRQVCVQEGAQRIPDYDLYVTLEPCAMCAAAIAFARLNRVIFGASDPKGGAVLHGPRFYAQPTCHHRPAAANGLLAQECGAVLKEFFRLKR